MEISERQKSGALLDPEGFMIIDADYRISFCSPQVEFLTGFKSSKLLGIDIRDCFSDRRRVESYLARVIKEGDSYSNLALDMGTVKGDISEVVISLIPLHIHGSAPVGAAMVIRNRRTHRAIYDLLEAKTVQLLNERNRLEAIFNSRLEGTFTTDTECRITSFNRSAERITGYSAAEAVGKKCWEVLNANYCRSDCLGKSGKEALPENIRVSLKEIFINRKDGKKVPLRVTSAPLYDENREHIGLVETFQDITELRNLSNHLEERFRLHNIIGRSRSMEKIYWLIENVSNNDSTLLITGESGTGKELVARSIHLDSYRRSGPFMALNCNAFAETLLESELFGHERGAFTGAVQSKQGRFELAQGGTLFLDEIGDISPAVQVKLLRVLETRQFERVGGTKSFEMDVRLIAATNKNLSDEIKAGRFRVDFYYRINVINIHLPPLRERMDDLPLLINNFIEKFNDKFYKNIEGITPEAIRLLENYDYPGNVRELENLIEHAFVMCREDLIAPEHLPEKFSLIAKDSAQLKDKENASIRDMEKDLIAATLHKYRQHRGKTAQALGINKSTLWRKMKQYNLL